MNIFSFFFMAFITTRFFSVQAQTEVVEELRREILYITTCIFLRIITFCIISSISFAGSKCNETSKTIITLTLKTYLHHLHHRFINQKWNVKTGFHSFTKSKIQDVGNRKKKISVISFQTFFFQKMINVSSEHSFKLGYMINNNENEAKNGK